MYSFAKNQLLAFAYIYMHIRSPRQHHDIDLPLFLYAHKMCHIILCISRSLQSTSQSTSSKLMRTFCSNKNNISNFKSKFYANPIDAMSKVNFLKIESPFDCICRFQAFCNIKIAAIAAQSIRQTALK